VGLGEPFHVRRAGPEDAEGILDCLRTAFEPYRQSYTPSAFAGFGMRLLEYVKTLSGDV